MLQEIVGLFQPPSNHNQNGTNLAVTKSVIPSSDGSYGVISKSGVFWRAHSDSGVEIPTNQRVRIVREHRDLLTVDVVPVRAVCKHGLDCAL